MPLFCKHWPPYAVNAWASGPADLLRQSSPFLHWALQALANMASMLHEMLQEPSGTQILTDGFSPLWEPPAPLLWQGISLLALFMTVSKSPLPRSPPWSPGPASFNTDFHRPISFWKSCHSDLELYSKHVDTFLYVSLPCSLVSSMPTME